MAHHVSDVGWVDFDLDVPLILPSSSAYSTHAESGRQWNSPTNIRDVMGHPVVIMLQGS